MRYGNLENPIRSIFPLCEKILSSGFYPLDSIFEGTRAERDSDSKPAPAVKSSLMSNC